MTFREKLTSEHPECRGPIFPDGCKGCPSDYGYDADINEEKNCRSNGGKGCNHCWSREIPEEKVVITEKVELTNADDVGPAETPRILDSGNRRQFETGAVRDIQEGKGRCDLLPLDVVGSHFMNPIFSLIAEFQKTGHHLYLYEVLKEAPGRVGFDTYANMFLEVAKHFEEGCKKYGENNWQKGIPTHCYIDSAVRHYLKYLRGDKDEPHDRAFCWNILCCIWTCIHKPELNDYKKEDKQND